jgi:hypothetical protein
MGFLPTEWNMYNQSFVAMLALCMGVQYATRADPDPEVREPLASFLCLGVSSHSQPLEAPVDPPADDAVD